MNDERYHIVRKIQVGESIPSYSTSALLHGCTFPVRIARPERKPEHAPEQGEKKNTASTVKSRNNFAERRYQLKDMLKKKWSNRQISESMNLSVSQIINYFNRDNELHSLARMRGKQGSWLIGEKYDGLFAIQRSRVQAFLREGRTYGYISDKIGMSKFATINRIKADKGLMEIINETPRKWMKKGGART